MTGRWSVRPDARRSQHVATEFEGNEQRDNRDDKKQWRRDMDAEVVVADVEIDSHGPY